MTFAASAVSRFAENKHLAKPATPAPPRLLLTLLVRTRTGRAQHHELTNLHFGRRDGDAVLLEAVVFDSTFDIKSVPLANIFLSQVRQAIPERQPVPFCALLECTVARNASARGQREVSHLRAAVGGLYVWVPANVTHENDFVDRSAHGRLLSLGSPKCECGAVTSEWLDESIRSTGHRFAPGTGRNVSERQQWL